MTESVQPDEARAIDRRTALRGAAVVGAVGLVAGTAVACGNDSPNSQPATDPGTADGGRVKTTRTTPGQVLAATSAVPVGGAVVVKDANLVVSQPKAGEYKAFTTICTHRGCPMSELRGATLVCGCHDSQFDTADGSVTQGPATQGLDEIKVRVEGGSVKLA